MSIATELELMEQAEREATGRDYRQVVSAKADGKTVDLQKLREVLKSLGYEAKRFDDDVAAVLEERAKIVEAGGYADLMQEYREAVKVEADHNAALEAHITAARTKSAEFAARSTHLRNEVQRVGAIRRSLINRGVIKDDAAE